MSKPKWKEEREAEYVDNLSSPENVDNLRAIARLLDTEIVTDNLLDECVSKIYDVMMTARVNHRVQVTDYYLY